MPHACPRWPLPTSRQLFAATSSCRSSRRHRAISPRHNPKRKNTTTALPKSFTRIRPVTIDAATLAADQIKPGTDAGIQIGWDDEQVTVWLNNSVDLLRYRLATAPGPQLRRPKRRWVWWDIALMCGYRGLPTGSRSARSMVPFHSIRPGTVDLPSTSISGNEFWVAPAPIRPSTNDNTTNDQPAWLPYTSRSGRVQVSCSPIRWCTLLKTRSPLRNTVNAHCLRRPFRILTRISRRCRRLLYGNHNEFRVRLVV